MFFKKKIEKNCLNWKTMVNEIWSPFRHCFFRLGAQYFRNLVGVCLFISDIRFQNTTQHKKFKCSISNNVKLAFLSNEMKYVWSSDTVADEFSFPIAEWTNDVFSMANSSRTAFVFLRNDPRPLFSGVGLRAGECETSFRRLRRRLLRARFDRSEYD